MRASSWKKRRMRLFLCVRCIFLSSAGALFKGRLGGRVFLRMARARLLSREPETLQLKKFGFDRTRINEVVGVFADCEGSEPEGERASQSAAEKLRTHNDDGTEGHQSQGRPVGTGQATRQREPSLQDHGIQPRQFLSL